MRSSNGGWHGLAGWGFEGRRSLEGLSQAGPGLRPDDGGNRLSPSGSSLVAANLRLAGLRPVPNFPALKDFLTFWETKLEGPLFAVTVAHSKLIKPAELRAVDGVFRLH